MKRPAQCCFDAEMSISTISHDLIVFHKWPKEVWWIHFYNTCYTNKFKNLRLTILLKYLQFCYSYERKSGNYQLWCEAPCIFDKMSGLRARFRILNSNFFLNVLSPKDYDSKCTVYFCNILTWDKYPPIKIFIIYTSLSSIYLKTISIQHFCILFNYSYGISEITSFIPTKTQWKRTLILYCITHHFPYVG